MAEIGAGSVQANSLPLRHWDTPPGGRFVAMEELDLHVEDVGAFFRTVR